LHLLRVNVFTWPSRTSRSLGAGLEVPAHHQGSARGRRFVRRHSWDFHPSQVCSRRRVRRCFQSRGPACRSPIARRDLFSSRNRPSKGNQMRKRTGDHESSVRFPGFISRHRSALRRISRRLSRSCLGLCLFQVLRASRGRICTGTTPCRTSASVGRFRPLSAHGFDETRRDVPVRERNVSLRGPGRPCVSSPAS
jgi:hypothetical protein